MSKLCVHVKDLENSADMSHCDCAWNYINWQVSGFYGIRNAPKSKCKSRPQSTPLQNTPTKNPTNQPKKLLQVSTQLVAATALCFWLHVKGLRTVEAVSPMRHVKSMPNVEKSNWNLWGFWIGFECCRVPPGFGLNWLHPYSWSSSPFDTGRVQMWESTALSLHANRTSGIFFDLSTWNMIDVTICSNSKLYKFTTDL